MNIDSISVKANNGDEKRIEDMKPNKDNMKAYKKLYSLVHIHIINPSLVGIFCSFRHKLITEI